MVEFHHEIESISITVCIRVFGRFFSALISPGKTALRAAENIMNIDEIVPGMKGYGKTVFTGDRVEMFNVEVLGILINWEAKSNMILIRMSGDPLEKSGIIAGMSGSPVYIDNRLIGAVAYGWSFAKEAIAGVTPINEMKSTLLNIPTEEKAFPWPLLIGNCRLSRRTSLNQAHGLLP